MDRKTLTGRDRKRETSLRVKLADILAKSTITAAGFGTIIAVTGIFAFLAWVVIPLFIPGSLDQRSQTAHPSPANYLHIAIDDYQTLAWSYHSDHSLRVFRVDTGEILGTRQIFDTDHRPVSHSFSVTNDHVLFGFSDGSIQSASIQFHTDFLSFTDLDEKYQALNVGEKAPYGEGVLELTPTGQFRLQRLEMVLNDPIVVAEGHSIVLVDQTILTSGPVYSTLDSAGVFRIQSVRSTRNLMTGEVTQTLTGGFLQLDEISQRSQADFLFLEGRADSALLIWKDGHAIRLDTRNRRQPVFAESLNLLVHPSAELTAFGSMIGKMTLLLGDNQGRVSSWFRIRPGDADGGVDPGTPDSSIMLNAHNFELSSGEKKQAVSSFAVSQRTRKLAVGYDRGLSRLLYMTSQRELADIQPPLGENSRVQALAISPRDDGLVLATSSAYAHYQVNFPHRQTNLGAIFRPVWYESASQPAHVWQSSSGTDEFEPKYGMMPLIFGTLKATFYTMLFGAPLALLAAVYTSEFLSLRIRSRVKPVIEMMASLPSVVLGFLAALVFAPLVEQIVPGILASFVTVPFTLLLAAFLWQLLPSAQVIRLERYRFPLMLLVIPIGFFLAGPVGSIFETWFFAGNIKAWLSFSGTNPQSPFASATGGWMLLMLPISVLLSTAVMVMIVNPILMQKYSYRSRQSLAALNLIKFILGALICFGLAWLISGSLSFAGADARGGYIDTYVQRNAMIVGFIMGFAVIPIIYTIAEDALSSVPEFLRAASLGAGATPWQTAIRIIIPTAMSGLFSALMVGFGRAVGETMIVLMAAGNTPIMDWNIFSGFRTLSANIAVELPEAVQNGTNYRMLFLAALTLFALTFVVNTVAEVIRQRFRRRAFQL